MTCQEPDLNYQFYCNKATFLLNPISRCGIKNKDMNSQQREGKIKFPKTR